jgi:UPF0755 protein
MKRKMSAKRDKQTKTSKHRGRKRVLWVVAVLIVVLVLATIAARRYYYANLKPVSHSHQAQKFDIKSGESSVDIAQALKQDKLIRNQAVFELYIHSHNVRSELQAGTYRLRPNMSVPQIVHLFVHGQVASHLLTILPGKRLGEIKHTFVSAGFGKPAVSRAFNPNNYSDQAALSDKPSGASLEGFLYPDSFEKNDTTKPGTIVKESLQEMSDHLTPKIRAAFANEGLSVYQGITLASIVQKEVPNPSDRAKVAQVFFTRLDKHIPLGADSTARYGAVKAGKAPSVKYKSPYNTYIHKGLPPGPISNVSASSLHAVAFPAHTHWLYFVTGDDGTTHFSKTLKQHETYTKKYCHKRCHTASKP